MAQQAKVQRAGQHKFGELALDSLTSTITLALAVITGRVVIALFGNNPFQAYGALAKRAFRTLMAFTQSLTKSVPSLLTGSAVALTYKCTVFSIGAEGQLLVGAIAAGIVGHALHLPAILNIPIVLAAFILAGMMWTFLPAVLEQKADVNMIVSTIMFSYVGQYLVQYLILGSFKEEGAASAIKAIAGAARFPRLLPSPFASGLGTVITLATTVPVYILLDRTSLGCGMCTVGLNKNTAYTNGINVEHDMFLILLMGGAPTGLVGGIGVTGTMGKIINGFSTNYGFSGIPIALMARSNPLAIVVTAFLMGSICSGSLMVQSGVGISKNMVNIVRGLVIVFLCAENMTRYYIKKRRGGKWNG